MSDSAPAAAPGAGGASPPSPQARNGEPEHRGMIGRVVLFVRQVIAELKKVVRPTRQELTTYTTVVLVFVVVVMAFVSLLDFGFGKLVLVVFGGNG